MKIGTFLFIYHFNCYFEPKTKYNEKNIRISNTYRFNGL
ncbi:hypothetical protein SRABI27_03255 [Pedobacter sp. Bi27]|nr:hypothetical protein SRABI36_00716 [Pedobacter sp. Bi36]CAH0203890.1 hypothetical protein SRABI126_01808 [Pedobacter sp. Bi126]CAH0262220.1 hypothetical protein SRABI27_03255 [Pedobacter sp. Bi27]